MVLKVGIISANWGTFAHLPAWRAVPGVEVTAICTSRQETAEAAARTHGIARAFWDAEAMAADPEIDILDCGTRPNIRHSMVLAALRNGKHVYNGIPFAADLESARSLRDASAESGAVAVADAYGQWLPANRVARQMIDDGFLGQPFGGTCVFNMSLFNRPDPHFPYNWFAQGGQGVSAVRNLGSHALHMLYFLFGPVEELVAVDQRLLDRWSFPDGSAITPETSDFASMIVRFASGMVLQFQVSWNAPLGRGWHLDFYGSEGRMVIEAPSFPTAKDTVLYAGTLATGDVRGHKGLQRVDLPDALFRASQVSIDADMPVPPCYPMALSMEAMVGAIAGKGKAHPDFAQAWEIERVQEAIRLSSAERRWVKMTEIA
ncbi:MULTISPECIES: Gfo/Idh/MocA family protein [unclassified Novosphingobium]|uniref:Gfo/Idh/MocA family protein n=1 Tax=unclassified Novosphingobium TaxID=2644732 RepID=UPI0013596935|nr:MULTISPECIES: Gfo/Idh/MocA family oxidoreductase [unclassified Novosphingobium]